MKNNFLNIFIMIIIFSIIFLSILAFHISNDYDVAREQYDSVYSEVVFPSVDTQNTSKHVISFDVLKEKTSLNKSSWIQIPKTSIDYPLVYAHDNEFYLSVDAYGNKSKGGAIFISCENSPELTDEKTIIFGHNMKDGTMFHDLRYYEDVTYAQEHSQLHIYTSSGTVLNYTVLCTAVVDSYNEYIYTKSTNLSELFAYLSTLNCPYFYTYNSNNVVILSTCIKEDSRRIVVFQQDSF